MDFSHFTVQKDDDGKRIDKIVRVILKNHNLGGIFGAIRKGFILLDEKKCRQDTKVKEGSVISVATFLIEKNDEKTKKSTVQKTKIGSELEKLVIFRNEHILFLNKPYGIPVQPSKTHPHSLLELILEDFEKNGSKSISFKPGPLHRLDERTTGIVAYSQSLFGARVFSEAIQSGKIKKMYLALLEGNLKNECVWTDEIKKNEDSSKKFKTVQIDFGGKKSTTRVIPVLSGIVNGKKATLSRVFIETGRTHQIRAQCALHGFPLLGDSAYGSKCTPFSKEREFFLHAQTLFLEEIAEKLKTPPSLSADVPNEIEKILENAFGKSLIENR